MNIYLHLMNAPHPAYLELLQSPPSGVRYVYRRFQGTYGLTGRESLLRSIAKVLYAPLPAVHYARLEEKVDLIHSTNGLMLLNSSPWVVDIEHACSLLRLRPGRLGSGVYPPIVSAILKGPACRSVIAWSQAAKDSLGAYLGKDHPVMEKTRVIYPTLPPSKRPVQKPESRFKFLFVGKSFYGKGGRETLEAFAIARRRVDCSLTFVSNTPVEYLEKYRKDVVFKAPKLGREEIAALFSQHHALLFPTYVDTYGFVVMEALAAGLPVISTRLFCIPELVADGSTGILLEPPVRWHDDRLLHRYKDFPRWDDYLPHIASSSYPAFTSALADAMVRLAGDARLWKTLSSNCRAMIEHGRLSARVQHALLDKCYLEAVE